ncbi:hypothetical protein N0V84_012581, partial [Fusarium piperis]
MRWKVRSCLPRLLLLSASASALTSLEQIEKNALPCPDACLGKGPADWSLYPSADKLAACPQPLLLSLGLSTAFDDEKTDSPIRACTLGNAKTKVNYLVESDYVDPEAMGKTNFGSARRRAAEVNSTCGAGPSEKLETPIRLSSFDTSIEPLGKDPGADVILATNTITHHLEKARASCDKTILFAYIRGTLVGLYAGSQVDRRKTIDALLPTFVQALQGGSDVRQAVEACDEGPASHVFGLMADPTGDFVAVQAAVKSWNEGKCVAGGKGSKTKHLSKLTAWGYTLAANARGHSARSLDARDTCRSIEAENGDTCETLAKRCGVSLGSFESANKATKDLCDKTPAGQPVCCSSGELPSIKAKIQSNGVCTSYDTKMGDICDTIAAKHGITVEDLENWNKKTWAWDGCGNLNPYVRICVSAGDPPMPASVWNAECGPTKNDTKPPGEGEELADLNPCPLNVCCNRWGMCGLTDEFCLKSTSNTGNPGTGQPGEGGCISNCERKLTNNGKAPEKYRKIGYFEAWNYDRPCQHMHVLDIDKSYSHIHFSFGEISVKEQFEAFKKAADLPAKKILAFGGWAFSNEAADTSLFRKAFSAGNREVFASRVVDFVSKNNLDGVDFDWEYPGATDIEGSDPGQKDDGDNYYEFLKVLRGKLPKDKSLSIAAPASYWYLKGFPIKKMAPLLDYIIFMTYDLHGTYLGERNKSRAKKGRCTGTAGYISDFEINEIIAKGGAIKTWYDEATDSDYLVYEGDEWVAYMSKVTKTRRMRDYRKLNFGGTTDWAIDLQGDFEKRYTSGRPVFLDPKVYETPSAACEAPCTLVFPPSKLSEATTIKPGKFTTSLEYGADGKTTIDGKETTAFITKTVTITVDVPEITTNSIMYSNVNVTQGQKNTDLVLRPSIKVPPIPVRVPDGEGGTTIRTLTLPPYPFSTKRPGSSGT